MAAASAAGAVLFCPFHSIDAKSHEVSSSGRSYSYDFRGYGIHRGESTRYLSCRSCSGPYLAEVGQPAHDVALARWGCLSDSLSGPRDCLGLPRLRSSARLNVHHFLTKRGWSEGAAHSKMPIRLTCEPGHKITNLFEAKGPTKHGHPRAGKVDLAQAWELLRQDVLYLDWRARQDVYAIKFAHDKVVEVLNPLAREQKSVGTLRQQLAHLQEELASAHDQVHFSEARVAHSLKRLAEMETAMKVTHLQAENPFEGKPVQQRIRGDDIAETQIQSIVNSERPGATYEPSLSTGGRYFPKKLDVSGRVEPYPKFLKNFWYPVAFTKDMGINTLIPIESFEETWVLFRGKDGRPGCVRDECAHRACPLSLGTVMDGRIQCPYHGWEYSTSGECKKMPSVRPTKASVRALPCIERDGMVWIWPGDEIPETQLPSLNPPANFTVHAEIILEMPVEHGLLMENLLDLAHAPFTHTSTFAKGWPVPNFVRFKTPTTALSGNWDPYPIDMAFQPPCMVLSTIGLVKPGQLDGASASACPKHLHQLHVCMPSTRGKTRLLYRMSLDFASWAKHIPFIDKLWLYLANQVLNEDLRLVEGQQERMESGANVWQTPVAYDKLGLRYRQWRIGVEAGIRKSNVP